jgi:hypothetical protein
MTALQAINVSDLNARMEIDKKQLIDNPELLVELTTTEKFSFDPVELEEIQLAALKKRFDELVESVPVLAKFAEAQKLEKIEKIEDGALLLLPHTMYKSYPLSALENNRYDRLNKWFRTLTAIDLSGVDASQCQSIDSWIDLLDEKTDVRIRHSSGTTGKLSFIPGNVAEQRTQAMGFARFFQGFGDEPDAAVRGVGEYPVISFGHARGAMSTARNMQAICKHLYGGNQDMIVFSNPGRLSADMLSLGGRLQKAQSQGELGKLQISATLMARREEFLKEQREEPERLQAFFDRLADEFRGKPVILQGVVPIVAKAAIEAVARGLENLFAPESLQQFAGGTKGQILPDDYTDIVARFSGVPYPRTGYGMTESASSLTRMCPSGRFHLPPNIIPYQLDPGSGDILPRTGTQTGRYGIFDVAAQHRWAGFLTGDQVTINWSETCSCGRRTPFIVGDIRRYSEIEGGDDKITCAGAPAVHENALQYMADMGGE